MGTILEVAQLKVNNFPTILFYAVLGLCTLICTIKRCTNLLIICSTEITM